jgi:hypothetical protein
VTPEWRRWFQISELSTVLSVIYNVHGKIKDGFGGMDQSFLLE